MKKTSNNKNDNAKEIVYDQIILADGIRTNFDSEKTGLNNNMMILGPPGSGKSLSITEPQIIQSYNNSLVVTMTKRKIADKYANLLRSRGYVVGILDLTRPESSTVGFDPMSYVYEHSDIVNIATQIVGIANKSNISRDPYWDETAISMISAEMSALIESWAYRQNTDKKETTPLPTLENVLELHRQLKFDGVDSSGFTTSTLDHLFEDLQNQNANSYAASCWSSVKGLTAKTVSCVLSTVNVGYAQMFTPKLQKIATLPSVDFRTFGERKTALFIITSPVNKSSQSFANMVYSLMFKELFEFAEECEDYRLPVPIHIICDDFATGAKIPQFADYISMLRAAGISFSIMIQSETQLESMYGYADSVTIKNNCDRTVYFGGIDYNTCMNIARRMNVPVNEIQNMPLGKVIVMERGKKPLIADRYPTLSDPEYLSL